MTPEEYDNAPENIKAILDCYNEDTLNPYEECEWIIEQLEYNGYTADYDLSGEIFGLKKIVKKMKLKIDEFEVKTEQKNNGSNYDLYLHLFKDKTLIKGMILKNDTSELEIVKIAVEAIDDYKNKKPTTIDDYFK